MTEPDPRDTQNTPDTDGDYIELSESFEKSAEVISYDADATYNQPAMMAMDYEPEE